MRTNRVRYVTWNLCLVVAAICGTSFAGRFQDYTAKYKKPTKPVDLQVASYFGTAGTEWLVGGGFLPDGTVVLVGNTMGPTFQFKDGPVPTVVGKDGAGPAGELKAIPSWKEGKGTPFVALFSPSTKKIKAVARLPWGSGTATDAVVDPKGDIYIGGAAGSTLSSVAAVKDVTADDPDRNGTAFVLKMSAAMQPQWVRTFADPSKGVLLRFDAARNLIAEGGWVYVFKSDGSVDHVAKIRKVSKWARGVSPVDQGFALGSDRNTHTGREPWRQPFLEIYDNACVQKFDYYRWPPKLVGTDKYRLVSDSSLRYFYYDDKGLLYAVGWSDGGNTVFERQPTNLDVNVQAGGLGFSTWGAGVGSFTHIMKIDTTKGQTLSKTIWCGFLKSKDKPNGAGINMIREATDGSIALAGGSAFGLIQTGDAIHPYPDDPGGPYVAILDKDMSTIRFSSTLVATGKVPIREATEWNCVASVVNGRHKLLYVCGAIEKQTCYGPECPAPGKNPMQPLFAGGLADGYFLVFDLGPAK